MAEGKAAMNFLALPEFWYGVVAGFVVGAVAMVLLIAALLKEPK